MSAFSEDVRPTALSAKETVSILCAAWKQARDSTDPFQATGLWESEFERHARASAGHVLGKVTFGYRGHQCVVTLHPSDESVGINGTVVGVVSR